MVTVTVDENVKVIGQKFSMSDIRLSCRKPNILHGVSNTDFIATVPQL